MKAITQTKQENVIYTYIPITLEAFQALMDQQNQLVTVNENISVKKLADDKVAVVGPSDCVENENIVFNVIKETNEELVNDCVKPEDTTVTNSKTELEEVEKPKETAVQTNTVETINTKRIGRQQRTKYGPISCDKCAKTFDSTTNYRKHLEIHKNIKKYKCDQCFESYNVEDNYRLHKAMHEKGQPTCPLCDRKFQRLASLKSHLLLHQVEETFSCKECLAEYEYEDDYKAHVSRHGEVNIPKPQTIPYICSYCNYLFDDPKEYKEHVSFHIKIKKLVLTSKKHRKRTATNKNNSHVCLVCHKTFSKSCLLERHSRIHSGERPFSCPKCDKAFAQKCTLQIHLFKHTGIKPFKCTLCPAEYYQKGNLRVHVDKTHTAPPNEKLFKCTQCTCIFRKVASLNAHITKVHGTTKPVEDVSIAALRDQLAKLQQIAGVTKDADDASKISADSVKNIKILDQNVDLNETFVKVADSSVEGALRRYLVKQRVAGNTKWFICSYCAKEFKKPSDLIRHIRVHTREKPYQCSRCRQSFSLKSTLISHMNTHFGRREYKCTHCSKVFTSARTLNVHYRKHDKSISRQPIQYKCSTCDKMFNSIMKADLHMSLHNPSNITSADIDNVKMLLKQPMLETADGLLPVPAPKSKNPPSNSEEYKNRPHKCCVCNAAFLKPDHMKRHMLIHSGEKNFKCDICSKSFYTSYALKEHVQLHSNVKNFTCKVCSKRFSTNVLLKRHVVKHSNARPYVCPYCKKRFKTVTMCRKHISTVHRKDINIEMQALIETGELPDVDDVDTPKIIDLSDSLSDNPFGLSNFQEPENTVDANSIPAQVPSDVIPVLNTDTSKEKQPVFKKPKLSPKKRAKKCKSINTQPDGLQTLSTQENSAPAINNSVNQANESELQDKLNQDFINQLMTTSQLYIDKSGNYRIASGDASAEKVDDATDDNPVGYSTIYINFDDLQSLNPNMYNSLLPQVKLEGDDPILMSAINEPQESNILFMDPTLTQSSEYQTDSQNFEPFNPIMFNTNDLNLNSNNLNVTLPNISAVTNLNEQISESEAQPILPALDDVVVKTELAESSNRLLMKNNSDDSVVEHSKLILSNENVNLNDSLIITLNNDLKASDLNYFPNITFNLNNSVGVNSPLLSVSENGRDISCTLCKANFNSILDLERHRCVNIEFLTKETSKECAKEISFRKSPELSTTEDQIGSAMIPDFNDQLQTAQVEISSEIPATVINDDESSKNFKCANCAKCFNSEANVFKHMEKMHRSRKSEKTKKSITPSETEGNKKSENACNYCPKVFKKPSDLKRHIRTHTGEKPFACDKCEKSFSLKSTLQSHMRTHNPAGSKDFVCVVCNTNYSCKASLRTHMFIHTGVRPYPCRICPSKFRTSSHRKQHEGNHVKEPPRTSLKKVKPLTAIKAASNFVESILLKSQEEEQLENIPNIITEDLTENNAQSDNQALVTDEALNITEPIPIDLLQQLQNSGLLLGEDGTVDILTSSLIQMENDVLQDKEVSVNTDSINLTENSCIIEERPPSGIKEQPSSIIKEPPSSVIKEQPSSTIKERRSRTIKEQPKTRDFVCDVCNKCYLSKPVLKKHQRIHKRGFKCDNCEKHFSSEDLLTKHTKLHLGYRPFSCLLCANSFSEEGSLKTHMKRIHNS